MVAMGDGCLATVAMEGGGLACSRTALYYTTIEEFQIVEIINIFLKISKYFNSWKHLDAFIYHCVYFNRKLSCNVNSTQE